MSQFQTVRSKRSLKSRVPPPPGMNRVATKPESGPSVPPEESTKVDTFRALAREVIRLQNENEPASSAVGAAMSNLFNIVKGYAFKVPLDNLLVHYDANFVEYVHPKSRRYFTLLAKYDVDETTTTVRTGCRRHIMSLWSWYTGKSSTGRPTFMYICTNEEYGDTDPVVDSCVHLDNQLGTLYELEMLRDAAPLGQDKVDASRAYSSLATQIREHMDGNVCQTFTRLEFFDTFKAAKAFIVSRAVVWVEFGAHKKQQPPAPQPVFQYQEELFPGLESASVAELADLHKQVYEQTYEADEDYRRSMNIA